MDPSDRSRVRAERLHAASMTAAPHARTGVPPVAAGPCPGWQVGAAHATWPDGHRSARKWRPHAQLAELRTGPLTGVDAPRSAGFPAPGTEPAAQVGHAVVTVPELLPGTTTDRALALNVPLAGQLTGRADHPLAPPPSAERRPRLLPP
ncbi:hypothetical protein [Streptomyces sp. NBC_01669]|uniref:hypothetical protein n=1 Tax=Streptomyces sp. NBC_01669 TaxID=2975909 RepID=UPI002252A4F5|nr:hypothetical protein [Streptomyces sp. NBC_01669]MCX4536254.1 hypothetical protein [Streptomyces sp. NBC_01669]